MLKFLQEEWFHIYILMWNFCEYSLLHAKNTIILILAH